MAGLPTGCAPGKGTEGVVAGLVIGIGESKGFTGGKVTGVAGGIVVEASGVAVMGLVDGIVTIVGVVKEGDVGKSVVELVSSFEIALILSAARTQKTHIRNL